MTLTTTYTLWLLPLCLALGALGAWLLYRGTREKHGWSPAVHALLAVARALVIALLAFFLLEPMIRVFEREVRKPVVVVAHDGSSSLLAAGDTAALRGAYEQELTALTERLGEDFEVRAFTYARDVSEGIQFDQLGNLTDIDRLFRDVYDRFAGPDLGAVIIDGDGIYNQGRDPRLAAARLGVPVFSIALGDTTVRPDLVLRDVEHNRITYLGNEFPLVARVEARHFVGNTTRVSVLRDGKEIVGKDLAINADPFLVEIPLLVKADAPGLQRYTVRVAGKEGEVQVDNNERVIYIDVLDDRQKVLILAQAPHPDVAALRESLSRLEGYQATVAYAKDFTGKVEDHDLVVLHQLPSGYAPMQQVLQRILERKIPTWIILGQNTALEQVAALGSGLSITGGQRMTNDAQAGVNQDFTLFTIDAEDARAYERFPPLQVPIGTYELGRGASALLFQKVGVVRTEYPLIAVQHQGERKGAITCGEGLWRWRLADQQLYRTQAHFDKLVHKLVTYLALKQDRGRFRLRHAQEFAHGEPVLIDAELYNPSYEPVNSPEAAITLVDEEGKELAYTFSRAGTGYRLDAGVLPPGRYAYSAGATLDKERLSATGEFLVKPLVAEKLSTVADHALWAGISAKSQGLLVRPGALGAIADSLAVRNNMVPRSYAHASFSDLIGLRWLFIALLALLTLEWAVRRRSGTY